jgi:hypothetical protein
MGTDEESRLNPLTRRALNCINRDLPANCFRWLGCTFDTKCSSDAEVQEFLNWRTKCLRRQCPVVGKQHDRFAGFEVFNANALVPAEF